MTILLLVCSISSADEAGCRKVLQDCDVAVQALQKKSALDDQIIADQEARNTAQAKELKDESLWKPLALGGFTVAISVTAILLLKH
jgi:hypothetical protein